MVISIECKKALSIDEFKTTTGRRYQMLFFNEFQFGKFNTHTIGENTDVKWLMERISEGRIFIPVDTIKAEDN
tara:strand:- start:1884 stop:2102 length:219 start_codon:yes stop_codon:yes gene_type:complete